MSSEKEAELPATENKVEEEKINTSVEIPFDVDNLFKIQINYGFDELKLSLRYIMDQLRNMKMKMKQMDYELNAIEIPKIPEVVVQQP